MQPALETPDIAGLIAETRAALAHLRADELEVLAERAEAVLAEFEMGGANSDMAKSHISARHVRLGLSASLSAGRGAPDLAREHRLLSDLLAATGENLRVLRRARNAEGGPRWAR